MNRSYDGACDRKYRQWKIQFGMRDTHKKNAKNGIINIDWDHFRPVTVLHRGRYGEFSFCILLMPSYKMILFVKHLCDPIHTDINIWFISINFIQMRWHKNAIYFGYFEFCVWLDLYKTIHHPHRICSSSLFIRPAFPFIHSISVVCFV